MNHHVAMDEWYAVGSCWDVFVVTEAFKASVVSPALLCDPTGVSFCNTSEQEHLCKFPDSLRNHMLWQRAFLLPSWIAWNMFSEHLDTLHTVGTKHKQAHHSENTMNISYPHTCQITSGISIIFRLLRSIRCWTVLVLVYL